jgi:hypothetical protein
MTTFHKALALALALAAAPSLFAAEPAAPGSAKPALGKALRYCNPLPMPTGQGAQASGDVTVIKEKGKYYMYCTGGGIWVSDDLLKWTHQAPTFQGGGNIPVAPHVVKYNNAFYLAGNDATRNGVAGAEGSVYKADNPLGPFTYIGAWKNTGTYAEGWRGAFDVDVFIDDDNKPYLYFPGRSTAGIYVVPLDPTDLSKFAGKPTHLFGFDKNHTWERYGEMNEYAADAWIEGPWLQKHNGTYYLQYSASGTQWKTYAEGYYTSKSPLGPFTYAPNNPLLRKTDGLVTGTAHGSIVQGPDGILWQFYTIVLSNPPGGRRIGMDPIAFDKDGNMSCRISDTPQWAPGVVTDPAVSGDSGSLPVTINKMRAMNSTSKFSSQANGHDAAYAIDNSSGTWWEPAANDPAPSLTIELSPATRFDPVEYFSIDSMRLMFNAGGGMGGRGRGRGGPSAAAPATPAPAAEFGPARTLSAAYQYKLEASTDGTTFTTVLDQTANAVNRNTIFEEIPPTVARFVRLTITNWPGTTPPGVIEFTVFGKADRHDPPAVSATQPDIR